MTKQRKADPYTAALWTLTRLCDRVSLAYGAGDLRFHYRPDRTEWIAMVMILPFRTADKLREDGVPLPGGNINDVSRLLYKYAQQPVARGTGKTIFDALEAVQPVKWKEIEP